MLFTTAVYYPCFDRITEEASGRRHEREQLQEDDAKVEKRLAVKRVSSCSVTFSGI